MARGAEDDLMDAAADVLRRHHFLVFHQRPARLEDGSWVSAVQYDGQGFPDLTATRPECPIVFVEVKAGSAVSKDQRDWIDGLQGDGRVVCVLRPANWRGWLAGIEQLDRTYPCPDWWPGQLAERQWRHERHKAKKRLSVAMKKEGKVPATMTTTMKLPHNAPVRLNSGKTVYLYRGHGSDGSVCVYGPTIYDGTRERWVASKTARFHCKHAEIHEVRKP